MSPRGLVRRCSGELNGAIAGLVERLAEQAALMLDDADDRVRNAADPQLAADRVERSERSSFATSSPIDDDRRAQLVLLRREDAPVGQVVLLDREVVAVDGVRLDLPRPRVLADVASDCSWLSTAQRVPGGQHVADERDVAVVDARPPLPLAPLVLGDVVPEPRDSGAA